MKSKFLISIIILVPNSIICMDKANDHFRLFTPLPEFLAQEGVDGKSNKKTNYQLDTADPQELLRKEKVSDIMSQMYDHLETMKKFYCGKNYYIAPEQARLKPIVLREKMDELLNLLEATHKGKQAKDDVDHTN